MANLLRLHVEKGPRSGLVLECNPPGVYTIGRSRGNSVQVARDPGISQKHLFFRFRIEDGAWTVTDEGSSNGTIVNGMQIEQGTGLTLRTGDIIKIGEATTVRVEVIEPVVDKGKKKITTGTELTRGVKCTRLCSSVKDDACGTSDLSGDAGKGLQRDERSLGSTIAYETKKRKVSVMRENHGSERNVSAFPVAVDASVIGEIYQDVERGFQRPEEMLDKMTVLEMEEEKWAAFDASKGKGGRFSSTARKEVSGFKKINLDVERGLKREEKSLDSMSVRDWFEHMMDEGPKYLYHVSESMIGEIRMEAKMLEEKLCSEEKSL